MSNPNFAITSGGGHDSPAHTLAEWRRVLDETSAAITMHAATRPEPDADVVAEATPGTVRVLCLTQPASDHFRAAVKRDADAAPIFNAMASEIWAKRRREATT